MSARIEIARSEVEIRKSSKTSELEKERLHKGNVVDGGETPLVLGGEGAHLTRRHLATKGELL